MSNDRLCIPLTFKKEEKWLYDKIMEKSGRGTFIKDILKMYFNGQLSSEEIATTSQHHPTTTFASGFDDMIGGL